MPIVTGGSDPVPYPMMGGGEPIVVPAIDPGTSPAGTKVAAVAITDLPEVTTKPVIQSKPADTPNDAQAAENVSATSDTIASGTPAADSAKTPGHPKSEPPDDKSTAPAARNEAAPEQPRLSHAAVSTAQSAAQPRDYSLSSTLPSAPPLHHASAPVSSAAHLTASIAGDAPVPLNGLAVELATRNHAGASSFSIRLDPADLGRIDVRLDVDNKGQVTSHLTVEKPETLAMLRQDAPQLQRALNDAGLKTSDNALQFSLGDQASAQQNADRGTDRQPQRLIVRDSEIIAAPAQLRGYGRLAGTRGGVDIRI